MLREIDANELGELFIKGMGKSPADPQLKDALLGKPAAAPGGSS